MKPVITESRLEEILPHGSGIDATWSFETYENGNVTAYCSYHLMDEHGSYDGWQDFKVRIFRHTSDKLNPLKGPCEGKTQVVHRKGDIDYSVHLCGHRVRRNSAYGLVDYLTDTIGYALQEAGIGRMRHETIES